MTMVKFCFMRCRVMRMLVFFDLPMLTKANLSEYRNFRSFLLKSGFIMMQKSVYSKLVLNNNSTKLLRTQVVKNLPKYGLVQLLTVTEKQFAEIEYLVGQSNSKVLSSIDRVVKL